MGQMKWTSKTDGKFKTVLPDRKSISRPRLGQDTLLNPATGRPSAGRRADFYCFCSCVVREYVSVQDTVSSSLLDAHGAF
jgi:hypothetical protein